MTAKFRSMPVYQDAMAIALAIDELAESLPGFRLYLKDQLRRASLSILLNLSEGAGELSPREKGRFYRMAKRSAAETGAALDFTGRVIPAVASQTNRLDERVGQLASQLGRMARDQQRRAAATRAETRRRPLLRRRSDPEEK